jgi:hypothetical protein
MTALILSVACALAALSGCAGAQDQQAGTFVLIDDRGRGEPNLTFGGVKLTAKADAVAKTCAAKGWQHNIKPGNEDQRANIVPVGNKDVRKLSLVFEDGVLIQITAEFHKPDPTRHAVSRNYAVKRRMADGAWAMSDGRRQTLVVINRDANRIHAVHVARLRDRDEAKKLLDHFAQDGEAKRAKGAVADPAPSDAPSP